MLYRQIEKSYCYSIPWAGSATILSLHFYFGVLTTDWRKDREDGHIQNPLKSTFMFAVAYGGFWIGPWGFWGCHVYLYIWLCNPKNCSHSMKHMNLYLGVSPLKSDNVHQIIVIITVSTVGFG